MSDEQRGPLVAQSALSDDNMSRVLDLPAVDERPADPEDGRKYEEEEELGPDQPGQEVAILRGEETGKLISDVLVKRASVILDPTCSCPKSNFIARKRMVAVGKKPAVEPMTRHVTARRKRFQSRPRLPSLLVGHNRIRGATGARIRDVNVLVRVIATSATGFEDESTGGLAGGEAFFVSGRKKSA